MRALLRSGSRLAFVIGLGIAPMVACTSDHGPSSNVSNTGTLGLPLQAVGASGAVYRLRDAIFAITDAHTGDTIEFLFGDDTPLESPELRKVLEAGNYTVTLLDGWHIERISQGGSGGSGGSAGSTGDAGEAGRAGSFGMGGFAGLDDGDGFGGDTGVGFGGESSEPGEEGGAPPSAGKGGVGKGGSPGKGGTGKGGSPGKGTAGTGSMGEVGERVDAQLVSDAVQFFSIFGFNESFVTYTFHVGEEELDFDHGRLHIGIDIIESPDACETPEGVIDPGRVLMDTNVDSVNQVALIDVLTALVQNDGASGDPVRLYEEIIDSYASAGNARLDDAIHCGDEMTDGAPSLNGYPIVCDRQEANQFDNLFAFFPMAFVNRIDLAPENGAHCGQQRMIFGNNAQRRMFMILEAQIPNPHPELGIQGCAPLAKFWLDQNTMDDPFERGQRLGQAFLFGAPELVSEGFGPFYTAMNLTVGTGQIRTNQFDQEPWTLREFKLGLTDENVTAIPFPVAEAPNGALWNENIPFEQGPACRENFLSALSGVLTNDPAAMSFVVDSACKDAESRNDGLQNYSARMSDGFREELDALGEEVGLSADELADRAQFAGSCIGCHEEATGKFLGQGVFAPFSNGFVHVQENVITCAGFDDGACFQRSSGLDEVFLPSRLNVLASLLGIPVIDDPCDGNSSSSGGAGGASGTGGGSSMGGGKGVPTAGASGNGGPGTAGSFGAGGTASPGLPMEPAPEVDIELPAADAPVEELQAQDEEIREAYGERTLGGKSAQSTH